MDTSTHHSHVQTLVFTALVVALAWLSPGCADTNDPVQTERDHAVANGDATLGDNGTLAFGSAVLFGTRSIDAPYAVGADVRIAIGSGWRRDHAARFVTGSTRAV